MPYTYTPEEIANAMRKLVESFGDTYGTSRETGIPERTLQRWKSRFQVDARLTADEPASEQEKVIYERYLKIRDNLLTHIERIYEQMNTSAENAVELAIALSRLIDRLSRIENLLNNRYFTITVTFKKVEPEDNSLYRMAVEHDLQF